MAGKKKTRTKRKSAKAFSFQLGWSGLAGVTVVTFCLFLWMFILGVWAGQNILLPSPKEKSKGVSYKSSVSKTIQPDSKKRAVK